VNQALPPALGSGQQALQNEQGTACGGEEVFGLTHGDAKTKQTKRGEFKDAKTPNIGPTMSEKPIFYQLFNKSTPPPARPSDLKLAHWKLGINLLSVGRSYFNQ
jgi:hypothetical protein